MNALRSFATNHPVIFVLTSTITWLMLLLVFMGIVSSVFRKSYNDVITGALGGLAVVACTLLLLWYLGWLEASGVTRLGNWQVWLLAVGGLIYFASASLYAFYGKVAIDFSSLMPLPASRPTIMMTFMAGLSEEILFRGLVLYALIRVWGNTSQGIIGSVVLASLLFGILHITQVFTQGVSPSSALLLTLQACIIAMWWGALVLLGGSVWPAVLLHFAGNAIVTLQGLAILPTIEVSTSSYIRLLWLSIPLGLLGIWLLVRAIPHSIMPGVP